MRHRPTRTGYTGTMDPMRPIRDPRLEVSIRNLERALRPYGGPHDDPEPEPGVVQAAVSLILREVPGPGVLVVKRAVLSSDPWSGHMALPGGRRDPEDPSLLETAVRETREETAVVLDPDRSHRGRLDPVAPRSTELPAIAITPFVFSAPDPVHARVNSQEIAGVYWVPIAHLLDPAARASHELRLNGALMRFPAFEVEGEKIWGLTYRILSNLLDPLAR